MHPTLAQCAARLLIAAAVCAAAPGASAQQAPVFWGQDVFVIPYQWSARTDPATAKQVILYASHDRGANWTEVTRAEPSVRSFQYRSARDGEVWFAVRTLDHRGRLWPAGGFSPELAVVVDTQIPRLRIDGALEAGGRLTATCTLTDASPDPGSLTLEARRTDTDEWTPVPLTRTPSPNPGQALATAYWQAPRGADGVTLRLHGKDLAGNPASASKRLVPTPTLTGVAAKAAAPPIAPPIAPRSSAFGVPSEDDDPFLSAPPLELPPSGWRSSAPTGPAASATAEPWTADAGASRPFQSEDPASWAPPATRDTPLVVAQRTVTQRSPSAAAPSLEHSPYHQASTGGPVVPPAPAVRPESQAGPSAQEDDRDTLLVNNAQFALEYELESVGAWGVSKVEVWGSNDGGQTWRVAAEDADGRSPVNIATPGEGLYGYRILVHGIGGLPVRPPKPGDPPEVLVRVDTTPPVATFTTIAQGSGYHADHLILEWRAVDDHLAPRPISLAYSGRPSGPWQPIASSVEHAGPQHNGRYAWRLRRHLPNPLYVRMEVRDRAGNTTSLVTTRPVALHFAEPAGRLRSVRPLAP
ncbi:MAG: hypothetical protein AAGB00_00610 [Planctomycetota bacterium]